VSATREAGPLYRERRDESRALAARLRGRERWLSNGRLAAFLATVAAGFWVFGVQVWPWTSMLPTGLAFVALLVWHDRVIRRRERAERRAAFYEAGLARLEDRWAGTGHAGLEHLDPEHPYARDLDLFGEGSLFELLCTARTGAGEATLARWLCEPSPNPVARERQEAVREWSARVDLREELALRGDDLERRLDPSVLVDWGAAAGDEPPRALRGALAGLAVANVATGIGGLLGLGAWPFAISLGVSAAVARSLRGRVRAAIEGLGRPARDLALLRDVLARIEAEPAECAYLAERKRALETDGVPPSHRIDELRLRVDLLDARANQLFAPIGLLLLWTSQSALAVAAWRSRCGPALGRWIEALGELEAVAALASYAFEHPDDPFPELLDEGPALRGRALGHPLLPVDRCVRNDLSLDAEHPALVVSGSNMSGKSTWLRTVGTNAVLAYVGAPVRAASLSLSPLAVCASIQVLDSLQTGISHFYAEILRLRTVVERSRERPVLFLLDEILHGTNSHDRRIGAEAVLSGLLDRGALGLVTTHDLALAKIAESRAPRIANVHFRDELVDGEMRFDYRLHDGVVTRSNALALMRAVGLDV